MQTNKVKCPFVESRFEATIVSDIKPFEIRVDCFEEGCPAKFYESLKCLNPTAPEDQKRYIGGHCRYLINICESCPDLRKCKKTGEAKIPCRQEIIDKTFRRLSVANGTGIAPKAPVEQP
jgi:hypothetical protein